MKKEYAIVNGKWDVILEPEYHLSVRCPNKKCKNVINGYSLLVPGKTSCLYWYKSEGERINQLVICPYCGMKFKLQVPANS